MSLGNFKTFLFCIKKINRLKKKRTNVTIQLFAECLACGNFPVNVLHSYIWKCAQGQGLISRDPGWVFTSHPYYFHCTNTSFLPVHDSTPDLWVRSISRALELMILTSIYMTRDKQPVLIVLNVVLVVSSVPPGFTSSQPSAPKLCCFLDR